MMYELYVQNIRQMCFEKDAFNGCAQLIYFLYKWIQSIKDKGKSEA